MDALLDRLRRFDALRDLRGADDDAEVDRVRHRFLPNQRPDFADAKAFKSMPSALQDALRRQGIAALYLHQAQAIEAISAKQDVVLEAPTASGKTLSFNVPLALHLLEDPSAHALMIHPMKALSNDQRRQFESLAQALDGAAPRRLDSWVFDGDTDKEHRALIKKAPPAVLFTNPEMLHLSFLQWHEQWTEYLGSIRLIILDEIHEYRGYFGTNVALLLRRFLLTLRRFGSTPQLVLATATCGNAEEHAYRLTGRRCRLVRAATQMRPARHFAFIDPAIPDFHFPEIFRQRVVRAGLGAMAEGLNTLVFCPSRRFAEEAAMRARRDAPELGLDPAFIAPYRSGLDADLRREVEDGLRTGRYRLVFSTNALEIGIDIGRLDACILAGFPDSVLSAWQRIGRIGRDWERCGYILFYAFNNPFDQFFASNIDAFLNKPLDEILISTDNHELMRKHLPYLSYEAGGASPDELQSDLGLSFADFALASTSGTRPERARRPNYFRLDIRGSSGGIHKLTYRGKEIGTLSEVHRFREAYVGAIYHHFGQSYRVAAHAAGEVILEDVEPHLRTEGIFYTVTQGVEILGGLRFAEALAVCHGKLTVFENFAGYKLVDSRSGEVVSEERVPIARPSMVRGFWLELTDPRILAPALEIEDLVGVEQLFRIGAPFIVPCDRHDLGTLTAATRDRPTVYVYETVPGGIGVAQNILARWADILRMGVRIAKACECMRGCPSCIVPPRRAGGGREPRKGPAMDIASLLLDTAATGTVEQFDPMLHAWRPSGDLETSG